MDIRSRSKSVPIEKSVPLSKLLKLSASKREASIPQSQQAGKSSVNWLKIPIPGRDLRILKSRKTAKYGQHSTMHGSTSRSRKEVQKRRKSQDALESLKIKMGPKAYLSFNGFKSSLLLLALVMMTIISVLAYTCYFTLSIANSCSDFSASDHLDLDIFRVKLEETVFGQHIAITEILSNLHSYFSSNTSLDKRQPLVLSFHGGTGVGKTLAARMLERHFAQRKANVHWYFPNSESLTEWIFLRLSICAMNIFILDDIGSTGSEMNNLEDFLNTWSTRRTSKEWPEYMIFVITTNIGSSDINAVVLDELKSNCQRQDLNKNKFTVPERFSHIPNFRFIPFLPLDRRIVLLCAQHFLASYDYYGQNYSSNLLDGIMSVEKYFPEDFPVLSKLGCKKIHVGL